MEGTSANASVAPDYSSRRGQIHFWLRRIHSLAGLAFGGFVAVHLMINATGINGVMYQQEVNKIHDLGPNLAFVEFTFIFLPLLIHVLYGLYATGAGARWNAVHYNYGGNVRYTLQRVTGLILLVFLAYHLATLHRWGLALIYDLTHWRALSSFPWFRPHFAYASTVDAIKTPYGKNPWFWANIISVVLYLLGVWAAVFHMANGLWTAAIAWGLTVTASAQKRWGNVCLAVGIVFAIVGTIAWASFTILGHPAPLPPRHAHGHGTMVERGPVYSAPLRRAIPQLSAYSYGISARTAIETAGAAGRPV